MSMLTALAGSAAVGAARADEEPIPGRVSTEHGLVDIELPIVGGEIGNNGRLTLAARGLIQELIVGLHIDFDPDWTSEPLSSANQWTYSGTATISPLRGGEDSNRFVTLLARLYGLAPSSRPMRPAIPVHVTEFDAHGANRHLRRMSLAFEPQGGERAEVFINFNSHETLQFNEKDVAFRAPLLRALTGAA